MQKPALAFMLAAALLTGCSGSKPKQAIDNRISDPAILEKDQELRLGDLGIEHYIPHYVPQNRDALFRPKNAETQYQSLQNQPVLHEVSPNPSIAPINGNYANNVISFGLLFLGTPYEYGSDRDNPNTFDCSDFARWVFLGALGMDLPKDSRSQERYVETFSKRQYWDLYQAKPGDLLFFMDYKGPRAEDYQNINPANERISHVGIYIGNGNLLHTASKATGGVRIDYMYKTHLEWRFVNGGSVLP